MIHHEGVVQGWSILGRLELEFGLGSGLELRLELRLELYIGGKDRGKN